MLTYGAELFGFENLSILGKILTDFQRRITKARESTSL